MSRFVQLHALTAYPPSNPNRDDLGRPKTALYGGYPRLRISSQALKRAFRVSEAFDNVLKDNKAVRTKRLGVERVLPVLKAQGVDEKQAVEATEKIVRAIGDLDERKDAPPAQSDQLVYLTEPEISESIACALEIAKGDLKLPKEPEKYASVIASRVFSASSSAVDLALFGRMLTGTRNAAAEHSVDAALQVSHALSTNKIDVEDDYFSALDDLNARGEAAHIGEHAFSSGLMYLYACVNRPLLIRNLDGDRALAARVLEALVRAVATASPSGKRNSYANHVRAEFMLVERGDAQPRSLASAFLDPVGPGDQLAESRRRLVALRERFAKAYGRDWDADLTLDIAEGGATLDALAVFVAAELPAADGDRPA